MWRNIPLHLIHEKKRCGWHEWEILRMGNNIYERGDVRVTVNNPPSMLSMLFKEYGIYISVNLPDSCRLRSTAANANVLKEWAQVTLQELLGIRDALTPDVFDSVLKIHFQEVTYE